MRTRWTGLIAAGALSALAAGAQAAENGLLGVKLFDSGLKVIGLYGSPDVIQAVTVGGMNTGGGVSGGGGGPAGGPAGGPSRPGPSMGAPRPGAGGGGGSAGAFNFGDFLLRQKGGGSVGLGGPPAPSPQGGPGMGGPPGGFGGPGGGPPMGGGGGMAPSGGGGAAENATYTRWIYNRSGSKYGFVLDKSNHVVQIEAIGLSNPKVRTSRGVTFGSTFAQVIKKYTAPDGYDISGDNILARFLNHNRVAFRFSRLADKKPQVVTGIVVAAGKG